MATCSSCPAEIFWMPSEATGKQMCLEKSFHTNGNIVLHNGQARVLTKDELEAARAADTPLYINHHANCPNSAAHRKKAVPTALERACPVRDCGEPIHAELFACPAHWRELDAAQQALIHRCYADWKAGKISGGRLRDLQQEVLNHLGGGTA